jgi:hypothetical protein
MTGYAWQIAVCSKCQTHVGWRFVAVQNKNLRPRSFFGLSSKSLLVNPEGAESDKEDDEEVEAQLRRRSSSATVTSVATE